ncbi:ABC transporter substrate-binding protein [Nocardioides sp.]|uniref:ABC transporter substrate-binding protein n=1 Tax=Nocardioides sp. TaxID=35761 RepID=UPI0027323676|nr:ABC transporter substrate-binding protein [Nocardioides sp.]MDP3891064.1 ABC transporter substrate-binding protein [Nocardioides sp.]
MTHRPARTLTGPPIGPLIGPLIGTAVALVLGATLSACGTSDAGPTTASGDTTLDDTTPAAAGSDWPRTVTSCGREVTLDAAPTRVVGIEGAAETALALEAGDQLAGWYGNAPEKLPGVLGEQAALSEHLGGSFPTPQLEDILATEPDLLLLYGYNSEAGLTQERLDELGVPHLLLSEACPEDADGSLDGYFTDTVTIATALGDQEAGEALVEEWRGRIADATAAPVEGEPSVFVMGNTDPTEPFASGGSSLADEQIALAGGVNAFGDTDEAFLSPTWEEVATRDPDVIVDGSGGLEESMAALQDYLRSDSALSRMTAVENDSFLVIDYYDNVPGPRAVDGVVQLA